MDSWQFFNVFHPRGPSPHPPPFPLAALIIEHSTYLPPRHTCFCTTRKPNFSNSGLPWGEASRYASHPIFRSVPSSPTPAPSASARSNPHCTSFFSAPFLPCSGLVQTSSRHQCRLSPMNRSCRSACFENSLLVPAPRRPRARPRPRTRPPRPSYQAGPRRSAARPARGARLPRRTTHLAKPRNFCPSFGR
ncbi:hypothetical protein VTK26DRAFT_777 [Humicola hyalothermophila]